MGFILSKYDDVRLKDNPFSLENRRESFYLRYKGESMEILTSDLPRLSEAVEIVAVWNYDKSRLRPPPPELAAQWRREEADEELLDQYKDHDPDELRKAAALIESRGL